MRYSFSDEFWSVPRSATVTVSAAPKTSPVAIPNSAPFLVASPFAGEDFVSRVMDSAGNAYVVTRIRTLVAPLPTPQYVYLTLISKFDSKGSC